MSFTEDELQAFSSILEQRLAAHRQEVEQALDQRLDDFRQHVNQRLISLQEETNSALNQLASRPSLVVDPQDLHKQLEAIEVQTELPWEELVAMVGKELDERLATLNNLLQHSIIDLEQHFAVQVRSLRTEIAHIQGHERPYGDQGNNGTSIIPEVLTGIEHLERVMESMQVAMSANHALLSNRLYHHQQLPLERAHPIGPAQITPANESTSLLSQAKERVASGLEPIITPVQQNGSEESQEQ